MQHTPNAHRVRQHARNLPHTPVTIDGLELARIHERIPVRHVDHVRIVLHARVRELRKKPSRVQVMVVLVDLPDRVADFQVRFEILHPVALVAVDRDPAVRALEVRVRRGQVGLLHALAGLRVVRGHGQPGLLVAWVWAEGVLLDECGSLPDRGRGGPRERVEEVVGLQEFPALR